MATQQTDFERMLAEDTFVVVDHDPATPRIYIGVKAVKPNGDTDATFTLDFLNGSVSGIQSQIGILQAQLADYEAMQAKIDQTLG